MFSSSGALRALLVAAAVCSPVLSLPRLPALPQRRSLQDYVDHLVYLDANKSSLYSAVEVEHETYGAYLDNHWGGLVIKSDSSHGSTSQVTVGSVSLPVSNEHDSVGFLQEDIEIDYYTTSQWPSSWPSIGSSAGVGAARVGIDITDSKSVINQYLANKWSNTLDNWYYDLFVFYDWMNATLQSGEIDFAGIVTTGSTLDWTSLFDISASQVSQYGLPDLSKIKDQPYIYLRNDGTFYVDSSFWVNGQQVGVTSQVPKTSSGSVVVDISLTERFSKAPDSVVKALYGNLQGSKYYPQSTYGYYKFSCDAEVSFTFTIGGVKYTVNQDSLIAPNPWGDQCIGTIFTKGQAVAAVPKYDIVFGFQFISSFYFRSGISHSSNQAYMKLLPLPEPTDGWSYGGGSWSWSGSGSGVQHSGASTTTYQATPTNSGSGNSQGGKTYAPGSEGDKNYNGDFSSRSTSTVFTTTTITHVGTTTVAWPPSGTGSVSGTSYGAATTGDAYGSSSSGQAYGGPDDDKNLAVAGNVAEGETDEDGNDLNLPHGSIADKLKHCLPAIIILAIVLALFLVGGIVFCLVRRRRNAGAVRPSAYSNIHDADTHGPINVPLYGAEEGHSRYADPYKDKE